MTLGKRKCWIIGRWVSLVIFESYSNRKWLLHNLPNDLRQFIIKENIYLNVYLYILKNTLLLWKEKRHNNTKKNVKHYPYIILSSRDKLLNFLVQIILALCLSKNIILVRSSPTILGSHSCYRPKSVFLIKRNNSNGITHNFIKCIFWIRILMLSFI